MQRNSFKILKFFCHQTVLERAPVLLCYRKKNIYFQFACEKHWFVFKFGFRAYASHIDVPKDVRQQLGIFDTTVRLSVGLENTNDLIKDLEQALEETFK